MIEEDPELIQSREHSVDPDEELLTKTFVSRGQQDIVGDEDDEDDEDDITSSVQRNGGQDLSDEDVNDEEMERPLVRTQNDQSVSVHLFQRIFLWQSHR